MKKSILILIVFSISTSLFAQDKTSFFQSLILGKGKDPAPLQLSVDVYPFLFLSSGGGGSLGIEFGNWQVGAVGFSVVPPDYIKNTFFGQYLRTALFICLWSFSVHILNLNGV